MKKVYDKSEEVDPGRQHDWNDMALGFLLARGVSPEYNNWELLSSYTCGDFERMKEALSRL